MFGRLYEESLMGNQRECATATSFITRPPKRKVNNEDGIEKVLEVLAELQPTGLARGIDWFGLLQSALLQN